MARAPSLLMQQKRLWALWLAALIAVCAMGSWAQQQRPTTQIYATELVSTRLAGYVSQEKRLFMYLFNGNGAKAQIA